MICRWSEKLNLVAALGRILCRSFRGKRKGWHLGCSWQWIREMGKSLLASKKRRAALQVMRFLATKRICTSEVLTQHCHYFLQEPQDSFAQAQWEHVLLHLPKQNQSPLPGTVAFLKLWSGRAESKGTTGVFKNCAWKDWFAHKNG